jgi:hypothetical protein
MATVRRTDEVTPTHLDERGGRPVVLLSGGTVPTEVEAGAR